MQAKTHRLNAYQTHDPHLPCEPSHFERSASKLDNNGLEASSKHHNANKQSVAEKAAEHIDLVMHLATVDFIGDLCSEDDFQVRWQTATMESID